MTTLQKADCFSGTVAKFFPVRVLKLFALLYILALTLNVQAQQNTNSLSFDGTNDYVTIGTSSIVKPTATLTAEAWVNVTNWNTASQTVLSNVNTFGYQITIAAGILSASVYRNGVLASATFNVSAYTGYHHICFTFDGRYIRLYTDGTLRNTNDAGATFAVVYDNANATTMGSNATGTGEFLNGSIDELRIWSTVRVPTTTTIRNEVLESTAGLLAYYRCNEGTAAATNTGLNTLPDLSANALHATLQNFALSGSASNWVEGVTLKAVNQASAVVFSNVQPTQITLSWTRPGTKKGGNGVKIFMKAITTGSPTLVDGTNYTANTAFGSGSQVGATGWYCVYDGTGTTATVTGLATSTSYRTQVYEYQSATGQSIRYSAATGAGNPANKATVAPAATIQASQVSVTNVAGTTGTLNWTRGDGATCIVFVKQANTGTPVPVNQTTYTANAIFKSGTQIGATGWYCVYKGTNATVDITGLTAGLPYQVMVMEFNGNAGFENYLQTSAANNPISFIPDFSTPAIQASNVTFPAVSGTTFTINWTRGNGTNCIVFVKQASSGTPAPVNNTTYLASAAFKGGSQIGATGWYCVYKGSGTAVTVTGLTLLQTYEVMVCEYNGSGGYEKYLTTTDTNNPNSQIANYFAPTVQASNVNFTVVNTTTATVTWTRGNGSAVAVFLKVGNSGTASPTDNTTYTANAAFKSGTQIGATGWYCIYNNTGTTVNITALTAVTNYQLMVCEYTGTAGSQKYNVTSATNNPATTTTIDYVAPVTQASNIIFSAVNNNKFTVGWTNGNGSNRIVFVKQTNSDTPLPVNNTTYTANTVFGSGTQIGSTGWYCVYKGAGTTVTVTGLTVNMPYTVMVCEYNGIALLEKYQTAAATNNPLIQTPDYVAPATQASNVAFSALLGVSYSVTWTRGNGIGIRVFAKQTTNTETASPVNNTTYTANAAFATGTEITGTGWYCIYSGVGTTVTMTGLTPGLTYIITAVEYNGVASLEKYNVSAATNNPKSQMADYTAPTTQASNVVFTNVSASSYTATWTNGNGSARAVFVKESVSGSAAPVNNTTYSANSVYATGDQIGSTGWYCVYKGSGTTVNVSGLTVGQPCQLMVCEYNGIASLEKFNNNIGSNNPNSPTDNYIAPTLQANNVNFSNIGTTSFRANWHNGDGTARVVFVALASAGAAAPVNNTSYTANTVFASGTQIGATGWYCAYKGIDTTVNITGFTTGNTYRVMVVEYNGSLAKEKYLTSTDVNNPANQIPDYLTPTTQASNILFSAVSYTTLTTSWTRGNGSGCIVFAKADNTAEPAPVNNTTYAASASFGNGTQIGSSGWFCVYKGVGATVAITNLVPGTTYRFMVCEYNGVASKEKYNTTAATNVNNQTTLAYIAPATQAKNITFSAFNQTSYTVGWTRGNGSRCAVFMLLGNSGNAAPVDNSTYTASATFGNGMQIGSSGWYCVYDGTGTSVNVTGLTVEQTYRVMVVEYNGIVNYQKYNVSSATNNPLNRAADYPTPTVQALDLIFTNVTGSSFKIDWTRGNGSNCSVFIKLVATGNAAPINNTTYTDNTTFPTGSQIGATGWYCVYKGSGTSVTVTGLNSQTTYRAMVCEYNGTTGWEKYLTTASGVTNPYNQVTDVNPPTVQATSIGFTNIVTNSVDMNWSRGNGANCAVFVKQVIGNTLPPNVVPANNTTYTANTLFGSGSEVGTSGWRCVFNGSGTAVSITGLQEGTQYIGMVCEYFGSAGGEKYNVSAATGNPAVAYTEYSVPLVQATNIVVSAITATTSQINWTTGSGTDIVFVSQANVGTALPVAHASYAANTSFGLGDQIGASGWYCVFNGSGNAINISSLSPNTAYRVMVCQYNGVALREVYNTSTAANNPVNFISAPIVTTWNGATWDNGTPDANKNAVIASAYNSSANFTCKNLTVNAVTNFNIQAGSNITVNENLTNNGKVIILSPTNNMNATGSLITLGTIINNDTMIANRYITPGTNLAGNYQWHYMSSPVASKRVQNTFVSDYVYRFDEPTNAYITLVKNDTIWTGKGYIVKTTKSGGKTEVFKGTFNTGDYSFDLANTSGTSSNGYNIVGNPYPSAIDWNAATGWTKTNISSSIFIWNPTNSQYATWDGTTGTNGGSRYIPPMQGFFAVVEQGNFTGTLAMTNDVRVHNTQTYLKAARTIDNLIRLKISGNSYADEFVAYVSEGENATYKMFSPNPNVPHIYANNGSTEYAILKLNPEKEDFDVNIGVKCGISGEYSIRVDELNFGSKYVYLKDNLTGEITPLSLHQQLHFKYMLSFVNPRFELLVKTEALATSVIASSVEEKEITIWANGKRIYFQLPSDAPAITEVVDMMGNTQLVKQFENAGMGHLDVNKSGIYFVRIRQAKQYTVRKIYVQ